MGGHHRAVETCEGKVMAASGPTEPPALGQMGGRDVNGALWLAGRAVSQRWRGWGVVVTSVSVMNGRKWSLCDNRGGPIH